MVAAAWYRARSPGATRNGRRPSDSARRSTDGGPSTAHHEPGSRCEADLGRRQRLERVQRTDLDVGAGRVQLVELVQRARAREVDHERTGPQGRRERGGGVGDDGVGGGDDHEVGVAAGVGHLRHPRRAEPVGRGPGRRCVGAAAGHRDRGPTARHQRGGDGRPGATGTHEGERPLRSTLHVHLCVPRLFVPAPVRVPVYSGGVNRRPVGRTDAASAGILVRQPGSRSASGTTHERPLAHPGVGHDQVGLVDALVAHEQHVDVERPGAPADGADPLAVRLDRVRELEQRAGVRSVSTATTAFR